MSKMKEVAALLGVEIGETFEVTGYDGVFRLEEDSMRSRDNCGIWHVYTGTALYGVLSGDKKIIKKPWKPKHADVFYGVWVDGKITSNEFNSRNMVCMSMYAIGNCFRTSKEAEEHKEELMEKLRKIYDDGKPLIGADE